MAVIRRKKRSGLLKRPTTITGSKSTPKSFKPQQARQLIRRFHVLQKNKHSIITRLNKLIKFDEKLTIENCKSIIEIKYNEYNKAYQNFKIPEKYNDNELYKIDDGLNIVELVKKLGEIDSEINQRGGIEAYQIASTQGQNTKRGGDSSKKLIEWLKSSKLSYNELINDKKINALEIGCLSPDNLISTSNIFQEVTKIDLNSQNHLILQQDFMERPLPQNVNEKFNLISCSLVINFVPSPEGRGEMLKRITNFLKPPKINGIERTLSSLFLVLPLPCITNSRYLDNENLKVLMQSLGFKQVCYYEAKKVAYWLYDWGGDINKLEIKNFKKKKNLYSGSNKNNFSIILS